MIIPKILSARFLPILAAGAVELMVRWRH